MVPDEKSAVIQILFSVSEVSYLCCAFKIYFSVFIFPKVWLYCNLNMNLFGFFISGVLSTSWTFGLCPLPNLGSFQPLFLWILSQPHLFIFSFQNSDDTNILHCIFCFFAETFFLIFVHFKNVYNCLQSTFTMAALNSLSDNSNISGILLLTSINCLFPFSLKSLWFWYDEWFSIEIWRSCVLRLTLDLIQTFSFN